MVGKTYFLLVRIKIKHMELSNIRRETTGSLQRERDDHEVRIMDGAPARGISSFAPTLGLGIDDRSSLTKAKQSHFGYSSMGLT